MGRDFEFLEAARVGDLCYFEKFFTNKKTKALQSLRRGPTSNTQDSSGYSALHHAALNGHLDIVRILLLHDANPNILDGRGSSPLHLAAWAGYQQICRLLLESPNTTVGNANVNALTSQRETALHFASQFGHVKVVATLLEYDAAPDFTTVYGETPLDLAAKFGRMDVVQLMVYAFPDAAPYGLITPLHLAARNGHQGVCEFLLDMNYVDIDARAPDGSTPLHESIISGHLAISRLLISQGANCHLQTSAGETIVEMLQQFPQYVIDEFTEFLRNGQNHQNIHHNNNNHHHLPHLNSNGNTSTSSSSCWEKDSHGMRFIEDEMPPPPPPPVLKKPIKLRHEEKMKERNGNGGLSAIQAPPKKPPRRNPSMSKSMDECMIFGLAEAERGGKPGHYNKGISGPEQWHIRLAHDHDLTDDGLSVSFNNNRRLRRFNYGNKEWSTVIKCVDENEYPTSPTCYNQPPTPNHPPPAPALAERKIFEKLRPLSAEYYLGHAVNCTPNIQWEFYFEADTKPETASSTLSPPSEPCEVPCPEEWLQEIRSQIQRLLEKIQQEQEPTVEPSDEDKFRGWASDRQIAPPLIDHLVNMGYDDCIFLNNGHVKRDILENINCDSEALNKFLRPICELAEWVPRVLKEVDLVALQEAENVKQFLAEQHLSEYEEEFLIFAQCKEWWCKLPLFTDEEMRIWFGMDKPGHLIRFRTALEEQLKEGRMKVIKRGGGNEGDNSRRYQQVYSGIRRDMAVPLDLNKNKRSEEAAEILVLFRGVLATLAVSVEDIRIVVDEVDLHKHRLVELLCVYQDGEDLSKFGYQLVDSSRWEFQTASIVNTARAVLVIAHKFGF